MKKRILSLALSAFMALALVPALGVDVGAYDVNIDDGISQEELMDGGIPYSPLWPQCPETSAYNSTDARFDEKNYLLASFKDSDGDYEYNTYDSADRLIHRDSPFFSTPMHTDYTYDAAGHLLSVITTSPAPRLCSTVSYTYDDAGRLSSSDGYVYTQYEYDAQGRIAKFTDPGTQSYTYDAGGRILQITYTNSDGNETRYVYNAEGQFTSYFTNEGNRTETRSFTYNADGCMTVVRTHDVYSNSTTDETGSYSYNAQGRLTYAKENARFQGVRPDGVKFDSRQTNTESYTYDAAGHLVKNVYTVKTPDMNQTVTTVYRYDAAGNMVQIAGGSGGSPVAVCAYDSAGNLTKRSVTSDGKTTWRTYTYVKRHTPLKASVSDFIDVKHGAYYYQSVKWAVEQEITTGTAKTLFSPRQTCTQGQILAFLWRAAGKPESAGTASYADPAISEKQYYYKALQWAAEKGIVTDLSLDPSAPCTRADAAGYLWRYAGSPAASSASFTDVPADSPCAAAVAWAVEKGVTKGTSATNFSPDSACTRGQIVTFLWRDLANQ
jgi:YD repeat-containing protein